MSTVLAPLFRLLRRSGIGRRQKRGPSSSKELLLSSELLVHFNSKLEITLVCDASSYGVEAVLAHTMPDGTERPVGYSSRSHRQQKGTIHCWSGHLVSIGFMHICLHHFKLVTDHNLS